MKHYTLTALAALFLWTFAAAQTTTPAAKPAAVDSTDGFSIQYDITRRVDGQNIRIVIVTDGPQGEGNEPQMPSTILMTQTAGVSPLGAVLSEPQMPMPKGMPGWENKEGGDVDRIIVRPVQETFGVNFEKREFLRTMRSEHDAEHKVYYHAEPLVTPKDWKEGKKTKKIAGFECQKATCTVEDVEYTVWYTTALPGTFSPMAKIFPPAAGVVLALESDDQAYLATNVAQQVKVAKPAALPADAVLLTPDEMKAKRRAFAEKAMPQGGNIRIRRN